MHAWLVTAHEPAFKCHVKFIVHGSSSIFQNTGANNCIFKILYMLHRNITSYPSPINRKTIKTTEFYRSLLTIYYEQCYSINCVFFYFGYKILFYFLILSFPIMFIIFYVLIFSSLSLENSKYFIKFYS